MAHNKRQHKRALGALDSQQVARRLGAQKHCELAPLTFLLSLFVGYRGLPLLHISFVNVT